MKRLVAEVTKLSQRLTDARCGEHLLCQKATGTTFLQAFIVYNVRKYICLLCTLWIASPLSTTTGQELLLSA